MYEHATRGVEVRAVIIYQVHGIKGSTPRQYGEGSGWTCVRDRGRRRQRDADDTHICAPAPTHNPEHQRTSVPPWH